MLIKPCGETALLIDLTDANRKPLSAAMQLRLAIESASAAGELPGVTETIPAAATVLVHIDPRQISLQRAAELISALDLEAVAATTTTPGSHIEIPTVYTGPDLEPLANRLQLSPQQLIALHGEITWTAAFGGFAPGFMYLTFDSTTISRSTSVIFPMAERAKASAAQEPTPPMPTTQTCATCRRLNSVSP